MEILGELGVEGCVLYVVDFSEGGANSGELVNSVEWGVWREWCRPAPYVKVKVKGKVDEVSVQLEKARYRFNGIS